MSNKPKFEQDLETLYSMLVVSLSKVATIGAWRTSRRGPAATQGVLGRDARRERAGARDKLGRKMDSTKRYFVVKKYKNPLLEPAVLATGTTQQSMESCLASFRLAASVSTSNDPQEKGDWEAELMCVEKGSAEELRMTAMMALSNAAAENEGKQAEPGEDPPG